MSSQSHPVAAPPWEFLLQASRRSLQNYELSHLNYAAQLSREVKSLLDQWVQEMASALLARWLIDYQPQLMPATARRNLSPSSSLPRLNRVSG